MSRSCKEIERRVLRHLHGRKTRTQLTQIHAHLIRHRLHHSNQILAHFVSVCGSFNKMPHAHLIFRQVQNPNILLFNSMIKGYSLSGPFEDSVHLFSAMKSLGIWPDEYTFAPLLKSCANLTDCKLGEGVHAEVVSLGFACFSSIKIGVVELYTSCGRMGDERRVFDEMLQRDVIVWNLMVRGFCRVGHVDLGMNFFRRMKEWRIVSWNSMISCLAKSGRDTEALKLFREMRDDGFEPDEATLVTVLPVCARLGDDDVGQWMHSYAKSSGLYRNFVTVGNSLIDFYCKVGALETAFMLFKDMPRKNVVSWNAMISGLALNGKEELGVALCDEMINKGVQPNDATFVGALACCAHAGLVQKGHEFFASMLSNHDLKPKLEHYGCMVDLLGRSGCVEEAYNLIRTIPLKPNAALWGSLLSSCRTHGDLELAELAIKELISLEPWNSGNYVLLSNIYSEREKWDEVEDVRVLMRDNNVKKAPGQSTFG
ncbi:hypothetical protein RJ639_029705 [Escallonia herrerae]|uniref:Chlororespiratory reduction 4 n=1 Tax=Escallonia herrerae TaxID=1293975 RepID=A0AA88XE34_9ASTE|nr:hypothetical protein RJ639_029705 [Escallonia herrerae]